LFFIQELDIICEIPHCVPISAHHKWNYDSLLEKLWEYLRLVRIYTKPKGQLPDYESPVVLQVLLAFSKLLWDTCMIYRYNNNFWQAICIFQNQRCSVEDFCNKVHRSIIKEMKYALVWGSSVKHQPQKVGKDHVLNDEDVVQIVKKIWVVLLAIFSKIKTIKLVDIVELVDGYRNFCFSTIRVFSNKLFHKFVLKLRSIMEKACEMAQ